MLLLHSFTVFTCVTGPRPIILTSVPLNRLVRISSLDIIVLRFPLAFPDLFQSCNFSQYLLINSTNFGAILHSLLELQYHLQLHVLISYYYSLRVIK